MPNQNPAITHHQGTYVLKTTHHISPEFSNRIQVLRSRLSELVNIQTGEVHPDFPPTLLHFWLLTEPQLNALAEFYHQRYPSAYKDLYPAPMNWREGADINVKRRKFGGFIGFRNCGSPVRDEFPEPLENMIWQRKWV